MQAPEERHPKTRMYFLNTSFKLSFSLTSGVLHADPTQRAAHGAGSGAAAAGPGRRPGAPPGEGGRGPRQDHGPHGRGTPAPHAAGLPAEPAGHGLPLQLHEPPQAQRHPG